MRALRWILPYLTIALAISLFVVLILDGYNPMMGFLVGRPFQVLVILEVFASLGTSLFAIFKKRKSGVKRRGKYEK